MKFFFTPIKKNGDLFTSREILDLVPLVYTVMIFLTLVYPLLKSLKSREDNFPVEILEVVDTGKPIDLGPVWKEK